MRLVDIFISIIGDIALVIGSVLMALFFQPNKELNQLILALILLVGGSICRIIAEK